MSHLADLLHDLRYALRSLRRSPSFTLIVVITLALGIGANTAIFGVINALLFRTVPVADPDRLMRIFEKSEEVTGYNETSYASYADLRDGTTSFDGIIGETMVRVGLNKGGEQSQLTFGQLVTGNYFDVLGVRPYAGRTFLPGEDETPGTHPVVVISYSLWQDWFGGDRAALDKSLMLNGYPFTVIGVAPPGFVGIKFGLAMDFWVPMMMRDQVKPGFADWQTNRQFTWLEVTARLRRDASLAQARSEVDVISRRLQEEYPADNKGKTWSVFPFQQSRGGHPEVGGRMPLISAFVLALVSLVLLVACANVVNLLLARATARRSEIGMRIALGAGRGRIIRQLIAENLLLALTGGALGAFLAYRSAGFINALLPPLPYKIALDFHPDLNAVAYTLLVSVLTGLILGLAPAMHALKTDVVSVLKGEESGFGQRSARFRTRNLLVVGQTAVSLVLLVVAGLFVKSLLAVRSADPGFDTKNGLLCSLDLDMRNYTQETGDELYKNLRERVAALPGVRAVSFADTVPLGDESQGVGVFREGVESQQAEGGVSTLWSRVDLGYFETMGIPLLRGRSFAPTDTREAPRVVVVNEALAQRLWPGEDPIGKRLVFQGDGQPLREVVGVARNGKYRQLTEDPAAAVWVPYSQTYNSARVLHVRTEGDSRALIAPIRQVVGELDPGLPVFDVKTMAAHMDISVWGTRLGAAMAGATGGLALVLALVGIYGVMAYLVNQRRHEMGLRMALGAQRSNLIGLIVGQGLRLTLIGVALGLVLAILSNVVLSKVVFGIGTVDFLVVLPTAVLFVAVAALASFVPAQRATKVDPYVALRTI